MENQNQLFIPARIKVGFQDRQDTYTQQLAYITYFGPKGELRKEKSWEDWRDKKIEPKEFDNSPHNGFILNKSVKRYAEYFGTGRNMIRIYDDRGFEFEITTGNLLFILMVTNCSKRALEGEFVYAWHGPELVLLPTNCDEYRNSSGFTQLQFTKFSAKNLKPGCSYKTRKEKDLIYLGRFRWLDTSYHHGNYVTKATKKHVFVDDNHKLVSMGDVSNQIATENTDIPVSNYAELVDIFTKSPRASKAVKLETKPSVDDKSFYLLLDGDRYTLWTKQERSRWSYTNRNYSDTEVYYQSYHVVWMNKDGAVCKEYDYQYGEGRRLPPGERVQLFVVLENGETLKIDDYFKMAY